MANPLPARAARPADDAVESNENIPALINFRRCVKSYDTEAVALSRGFKTALFIQQFKSGLLRADDSKELRVH